MKNPIVNFALKNQFLSTIIFLGLLLFLYEIRGILIIIFASFIIMSSIYPLVKFLKSHKVPIIISATLAYVVLISAILLLIIPVLPLFISQVSSLFESLPEYLSNASSSIGIQITKQQIDSALLQSAGPIGQRAISATGQVFGGIFSILTIIIISFYMILDRNRLETSIPKLFPQKYKKLALSTIYQIEEKLGSWLRGQIVLSFAVGALTWIVLTALNIEFALPLAIIAGMLEIIPTLGPIIAAVPAVIVGLSVSPFATVSIIAAYTLIQVAENNILVPKIMEKAVGLNPVLVIVVILIGANLLGIIGALLSIPFVSALIIIIRAFNQSK